MTQNQIVSGRVHSVSEQDALRRTDEYKDAIDASTRSIANLERSVTRLERDIQDIGGHVELSNRLQILGINRPGGFAEHVYDLIRMKAHETQGADDQYFVYHPDNCWYPAFHGLVERNGGLPASFSMKSNDLDQLCLHMQSLRSTLLEDAPFHLLIPAWETLRLHESLHFPKELQPLSIEGITFNGQPFVTMNVPRAPKSLFRDVTNEVESEEAAKHLATVAIAFSLAVVGWTGARLVQYFLPTVPFWALMLGSSGIVAIATPLGRICGGLEKKWRVTPARIVGSDKRVEVEEIERDT